MGLLNCCMTSDGHTHTNPHTYTNRRGNNIHCLPFITKYDMLGKYEQLFCRSGRRNLQKRSQVADGGVGLQIWRVDANIVNDQSRTSPPIWELGLKTVNKQQVTKLRTEPRTRIYIFVTTYTETYEIDRLCGQHGKEDKVVHNFGGITWRKKRT
jgi:hypothetical protein